MVPDSPSPIPVFCNDAALGYERNRTRLLPNQSLQLDAGYRLTHLPLVNPAHPDVIASTQGKDYVMGRHGPMHSLVLPIPQQELEEALPYQELVRQMRRSSFSSKIAWDIVEKRRGMLHATLCGSLGRDEEPPLVSTVVQDRLRSLGPFQMELRGLFSGNVNVGRLYLKTYPVLRGATQAFHQVQHAMERPLTDLYVVGLFNLTDHLDANEAKDLSQLIEDWWDKPIMSFVARELWLLTAFDDLVLDSRLSQRLTLAPDANIRLRPLSKG